MIQPVIMYDYVLFWELRLSWLAWGSGGLSWCGKIGGGAAGWWRVLLPCGGQM
jgi:hypothetical protein